MMTTESMEYDIVIVGAGPSGLSAAIRLTQLADQQQKRLRICVLEKGSQVGAHILSGAVLDPIALQELLPHWQTQNPSLYTAVQQDQFLWLTEQRAFNLPTPPPMRNTGNYIISLGRFTQMLAKEAERLGVEIFTGFAATEMLYNSAEIAIGVKVGAFGLDKLGTPKNSYQAGIPIYAKYTLLAEGARGSLTKSVSSKFKLQAHSDPQTYGIGIKELWTIPTAKHQLGLVTHSIGWPLDNATYGGSFIYHLPNNSVSIGFVVGLDYQNPYLDPFQEFQRFKQHPRIRTILEGGSRIGYGARALNEGGLQSIPKLHFPGGMLLGCAAGFLNVAKIKGIHTAMKSGMVAAETVFDGMSKQRGSSLTFYDKAMQQSWVWRELTQVRNIRPGFRWGTWQGMLNAFVDTYLLRGKAPWTLHHKADHLSLKNASLCKPIPYPKPDGKISFDKTTSLLYSNVNHEDNQPCHLKLKDSLIPLKINLTLYAAPEQRYCPANVYEIIYNEKGQDPRLQINAQNCIHCKTCDIKDPEQNIDWTPPEGGGGPNYSNM